MWCHCINSAESSTNVLGSFIKHRRPVSSQGSWAYVTKKHLYKHPPVSILLSDIPLTRTLDFSHSYISRVQDDARPTVGMQEMFVREIKRGRQWGRLGEEKGRETWRPSSSPRRPYEGVHLKFNMSFVRWAKARYNQGLQKEQELIHSFVHLFIIQ